MGDRMTSVEATSTQQAAENARQQVELEELCARHRSFGECLPAESALVGVYQHSIYPMADFIPHLSEGIVQPDDIHEQDWLPVYERLWARTGLFWGDLMHWAAPLNGFPWMEAILGCRVFVSHESNSVWVEAPEGFRLGDSIELDPKNPWYRKLLDATKALVDLSAGRFPVASGIMRGISDLMAALLGSTPFYYAICDQPEKLLALAGQLGRFWIEVLQSQYAVIRPFANGYVNAGLWMPGLCPVYQEDAAALISAQDFEGVIGEIARHVLEAFDDPILHLHSGGLQIIESFLEMEKHPVFEVNIDPSGPELNRLLPTFKRMKSRAALEVFGSPQEIQVCLEQLTPDGLACLILEPSLEEADA
jgi:hypothetical protein